jgi:hypothetical protein
MSSAHELDLKAMTDRMMRLLWLGEQQARARDLAMAIARAGAAAPAAAVPAALGMPAAGSVHPELSVRDSLVLMLHVGAEIEHALLVQYLFAAYSIRTNMPIPGAPAGCTTTEWQDLILQTAREEMGHLLTIQNALTLLGGPLHFDRDNYPFSSRFYPYDFELERLTIESLSRYIAAEMPEEGLVPCSVLSAAQLAAIRQATGGAVNRVGLLFQAIATGIAALNEHEDLRPQDQPWQVDGGVWGATFLRPGDLPTPPQPARGVVASQMLTKGELAKVLGFVATQGESPDQMFADSHFSRFAKIYREFEAARKLDPSFDPARPILKNPNTTAPPDPHDVLTPTEQAREQVLAAGRLRDPKAQLWAHLFNLRYRILLTALHHHCLLGPIATPGAPSPATLVRDELAKWAFEEMLYGAGSLRDLAIHLGGLTSGIPGRTAGAPFELPYTLELPAQGPARWRLYAELFNASQVIVEDLRNLGPTPTETGYLCGIIQRDSGPPAPSRRDFLVRVKNLPA